MAETAQSPKSPRKGRRLWVRATDVECRAVTWLVKRDGLARGEVLRRHALNEIVRQYEARNGA